MFPHPSPLLTVAQTPGGGSGGGFGTATAILVESTQNNGHSTYTAIGELEVAATAGGADLTDGATAFSGGSGSDVAGNEPAKAYDGNLGTYWARSTTTTASLGSDLTSSSAVEQVRIWCPTSTGRSAWMPKNFTVKLYSGASYVTIATCQISEWVEGRAVYLNSDGTMVGDFRCKSYTSRNYNGYASKGNIYTANADLTLNQVEIYIAPLASETYKVVVALVNGSNVITSIAGQSATQVVSSSGTYTFTFTPIDITSAQRFAIILVRTDGTGTTTANPGYELSSLASSLRFTAIGSVRYASNSPAVSDSILFNAGHGIDMIINFTSGFTV